MERLRYVFAGLALAGFIAALCTHVAALRGIDLSAAHPQVWSLHVGIFVVFLPFAFFAFAASMRPAGAAPTGGVQR